MSNKLNAVNLLLCSERGRYIPRDFANECDFIALGISEETAQKLETENEFYWDVWSKVLDTAQYIDADGNIYRLHQDGDLWLICYELMTNEEKINFGFDMEDSTE